MTVVVERRPRRTLIVRAMWRLELGCGHTAFATEDEAHSVNLARFCYACDRYVKIDSAEGFSFKTSNVSSRSPMKNHEIE